ncbi:hypothetical protein [Aeromonas caviae]|uniref:hypothetical protein n=1 Tax=Aeromonas caviae TaxID=648 RepID=UPI001CC43F4A|nr:hypothetical protein [Aeromonas caviae]
MTHPTLVQLVAAGAVRVVVAVGQPGGWTLLVRYGLADGDHDTDGPGGNQLDEGGMSDGVHKGKFRDKG